MFYYLKIYQKNNVLLLVVKKLRKNYEKITKTLQAHLLPAEFTNRVHLSKDFIVS